jgi:hypothetical protein
MEVVMGHLAGLLILVIFCGFIVGIIGVAADLND